MSGLRAQSSAMKPPFFRTAPRYSHSATTRVCESLTTVSSSQINAMWIPCSFLIVEPGYYIHFIFDVKNNKTSESSLGVHLLVSSSNRKSIWYVPHLNHLDRAPRSPCQLLLSCTSTKWLSKGACTPNSCQVHRDYPQNSKTFLDRASTRSKCATMSIISGHLKTLTWMSSWHGANICHETDPQQRTVRVFLTLESIHLLSWNAPFVIY